MRRLYTIAEKESLNKRLEELKQMESNGYQNLSHEEEFARRVELAVAEAQLNPSEEIKQFYSNFI